MLLKAENLALRYPNGALGIEDVSIEIDEGQIVALIGANGAGKTTTCRALSGVLRTEDTKIVRGKVFFDAVNVTGCVSISSLQGCIGLAPSGTR
jgi:branched-chain amino acid transport system ATP-binding protein